MAELRGEGVNFGGGVECIGDVCRPVDQFGQPIDVDNVSGHGYWWSRIAITLVVLAGVLTLAAVRLVVPPGMRGRIGIRRRQHIVEPSDV